MDELLTVDEVAKLLKLSPFTIREYAKKGRIPALKVGSQWRFKKSELMNQFNLQGKGGENL